MFKNVVSAMVLLGLMVLGTTAIYGAVVQSTERESPIGVILSGEHKLRKMVEYTQTDSKISGNLFLFVGDLSGKTTTTVLVRFAWEMNDGIYAISSLPIEKFRIKLDDNVIMPTIKFRWRPRLRTPWGIASDIQGLMDECVIYALITVQTKDWPIQIRLPLDK
jgi:hypothetical protein